jgi:hypothetical protein
MCTVPAVIPHVAHYTSDSPLQSRPGTVIPVLVFSNASEEASRSYQASETRSTQSPSPSTKRTRTRYLFRRDTTRSNGDRKKGRCTVAKVLKTLGKIAKRVVDVPVCIVLVTAGAVAFVVSGTVQVAWWVVKTAAAAVGGVVACVVGIVCCPCLTLAYAQELED